LFTADGFALPNGKPPARGHEAIRAAYAGPGGPLKLRALAYATSDTVGYVIGAYTYGERTAADVGKFVLALRKAGDGRWMIAADIDNSIRR
jgi:ketosteroid isomerase-like protein